MSISKCEILETLLNELEDGRGGSILYNTTAQQTANIMIEMGNLCRKYQIIVFSFNSITEIPPAPTNDSGCNVLAYLNLITYEDAVNLKNSVITKTTWELETVVNDAKLPLTSICDIIYSATNRNVVSVPMLIKLYSAAHMSFVFNKIKNSLIHNRKTENEINYVIIKLYNGNPKANAPANNGEIVLIRRRGEILDLYSTIKKRFYTIPPIYDLDAEDVDDAFTYIDSKKYVFMSIIMSDKFQTSYTQPQSNILNANSILNKKATNSNNNRTSQPLYPSPSPYTSQSLYPDPDPDPDPSPDPPPYTFPPDTTNTHLPSDFNPFVNSHPPYVPGPFVPSPAPFPAPNNNPYLVPYDHPDLRNFRINYGQNNNNNGSTAEDELSADADDGKQAEGDGNRAKHDNQKIRDRFRLYENEGDGNRYVNPRMRDLFPSNEERLKRDSDKIEEEQKYEEERERQKIERKQEKEERKIERKEERRIDKDFDKNYEWVDRYFFSKKTMYNSPRLIYLRVIYPYPELSRLDLEGEYEIAEGKWGAKDNVAYKQKNSGIVFYPFYYNPETKYDPKTLASKTVYWFRIKGYKKGYFTPDIRYFEILIPRQTEETREKDRIYQEQQEDEAYAKKNEKALKSQRERMEESQRERIKESQNREERKRVEDIEKENKNQELERRRVKELERIKLAKENEYKESERKRVDDIEKEKEKEIVNKQVNTTGPSYFNKALNWLSSNPPSRLNF